ncbi:MAG: DUF1080 domain-containing protein [Planctomycetes bacterium]|nr:DUF1080 domain-containing protein [Planctomycetota bacterium]
MIGSTTRGIAALLLACTALAAQDFEPLFDGKTLDGWRGDPAFWSVVDGAIVGRSTPERPCTRNTFLVRDGEFGDFELRFAFRISGGNSGMQFRSKDLGDFAVAGPQADMEAGPNYTGMLYEERGRGIMAPRGEHAHYRADGEVARRAIGDAAALQALISADGWNEYVVRAVGRSVTLAINGHVTASLVDDDSGRRAERGLFAIQLHAGPPMEVRYRDLRVRRLPADAPPMPDGVSGAAPAPRAPGAAAPLPQWIWSRSDALAEERITLRGIVKLDAPATSLRVLASCDNEMTLFVDGRRVLRDDQWETLASATVRGPFAAGEHEIRVDCANHGGPAAFVMRGEFTLASGGSQLVLSDTNWRWAASNATGDWQPVHSFGTTAATRGPWPDPFVPRTATPAEKLVVADGFRVELVRSAGFDEGSWIALGFDPKGRAIVSRERSSLARITLPTTPGGETQFEALDETPQQSMGFDWLGDTLYMQGRDATGWGLFALRDADGDGRHEDIRCLLRLGDGGEHGAHAVRAGPDGHLWLMNGNMSPLPKVLAETSPVRWQAEDVMLPLVEDPRGHAVGVRIPGGHVLRVAPDGSVAELFAGGFRNAYDIAFGPDGELFTFDSDMEWDIGLPWYRPTRVYHVVAGADFGWRSGAGCNSVNYRFTPPPVIDTGLGSPTGVLFGTKLAFHPDARGALYVADWAYGRILSVQLTPVGGSYEARVKSFVTGKPLNVTDLAAGPDGALWFTTGGRGTQSGLYRVSFDGPSASPAGERSHALSAQAQRRRALQADQIGPREGAVDRAFAELGAEDKAVAHAARVALEAQPLAGWRARALGSEDPATALVALHALVRVGGDGDRRDALVRLLALPAERFDRERRIAWLRTLFVALVRGADGAPRAELLKRLDPQFPAKDFDVDRELMRLLVVLGASDLPARALALVEALEVGPAIEIAYSLRLVADGWPEGARARWFAWLGRAKTMPGGLSFRGYVEAIERDALQRAPAGEREALAALARPVERVLPSLADVARAPRAWSLAELEPLLPLADAGRDFERGRSAFTKAVCVACHRVDGNGGDVGPDLTAVASRFSRRDLLLTILEPSRDISDQYANLTIELRDGSAVVGRIVREDAETLEVMTDPISRATRTLRVRDVAARQPATISPMPASLLNLLSLDEVLDLLAYLEAGGNPNLPVFGR